MYSELHISLRNISDRRVPDYPEMAMSPPASERCTIISRMGNRANIVSLETFSRISGCAPIIRRRARQVKPPLLLMIPVLAGLGRRVPTTKARVIYIATTQWFTLRKFPTFNISHDGGSDGDAAETNAAVGCFGIPLAVALGADP